MHITFNTFTLSLDEEPLDIGYASEKVAVSSIKGETSSIGGHTGKTQLIISLPFIDETIEAEVKSMADAIAQSPLIEADLAVIFDAKEEAASIEGVPVYLDSEGAFGDMYGTRLVGEPLAGKLTKALFIISKDGALFYDEFVPNILEGFHTDTALSKLAVAQSCYTGQGCHE